MSATSASTEDVSCEGEPCACSGRTPGSWPRGHLPGQGAILSQLVQQPQSWRALLLPEERDFGAIWLSSCRVQGVHARHVVGDRRGHCGEVRRGALLCEDRSSDRRRGPQAQCAKRRGDGRAGSDRSPGCSANSRLVNTGLFASLNQFSGTYQVPSVSGLTFSRGMVWIWAPS